MASRVNKTNKNLRPEIVVPDYFFTGNESTIVAIYNEPLEDVETMTLEFPGDVTGNSITPVKLVQPRRVGSQTIVFKTPVYASANRGVVEIRPLLKLTSGERVELPTFKILLKHPICSVMELCMNLSTNEAVLPVLISLMVHCQTDPSTTEDHFKDPHIDRIMATLVGSRSPHSSNAIGDIILPSKKWRKMTLTDFAREFKLSSMEKQAYDLLHKRHSKQQQSRIFPARPVAHSIVSDEFTTSNLEVQQSHSDMDIHKAVNEETRDIQSLIKNAKSLCKVVKGYKSKRPNHLPLTVGQLVYVVTKDENPDKVPTGIWYGVCEDKCGYFPSKCVRYVRQIKRERSHSTIIDMQVVNDIERSNTLRGQNITSDELKRPPIHQYENIVPISIDANLSDNSQRDSPQMSHPHQPRFRISSNTEYLSGTQSDSDIPPHDTMPKLREKVVKLPLRMQVPHIMQKTSFSPTSLKYPSSEAVSTTSSHFTNSHISRSYDDSTGDSDSSVNVQLSYSEDETCDDEDQRKHDTCTEKRLIEQSVLKATRMGLRKTIPPNPPPRMPKKISFNPQHQEPTLQIQPQLVSSPNTQQKKKPLPLPPKKSNKPVRVASKQTSTEENSDASDYEEVNVRVSPVDQPSCNAAVQYVEMEVVEDHLYDIPQLPEERLVPNQSQRSGPQSEDGFHDVDLPTHHHPSKQLQFHNWSQNVSMSSTRQNIMHSSQRVPPRNVYRDEAHGIQHSCKTPEAEISITLSNSAERQKKAKKPIPPPKHVTARSVQCETDKLKEQAFSKHKGVPTPFIRTHL